MVSNSWEASRARRSAWGCQRGHDTQADEPKVVWNGQGQGKGAERDEIKCWNGAWSSTAGRLYWLGVYSVHVGGQAGCRVACKVVGWVRGTDKGVEERRRENAVSLVTHVDNLGQTRLHPITQLSLLPQLLPRLPEPDHLLLQALPRVVRLYP
jgi:hypothetical protein